MQNYFDVIAISSEKDYVEKIGKREVVETHHLEIKRQIKFHKDFIVLLNLTLYFIKTKPSKVYSYTPKGGIGSKFATFLASRASSFSYHCRIGFI